MTVLERNANAIVTPPGRYRCAGEDCPEPGYVHPPEKLYLHELPHLRSFFCSVCKPKSMFAEPGAGTRETNLDAYLKGLSRQPENGWKRLRETEKGPDCGRHSRETQQMMF